MSGGPRAPPHDGGLEGARRSLRSPLRCEMQPGEPIAEYTGLEVTNSRGSVQRCVYCGEE